MALQIKTAEKRRLDPAVRLGETNFSTGSVGGWGGSRWPRCSAGEEER